MDTKRIQWVSGCSLWICLDTRIRICLDTLQLWACFEDTLRLQPCVDTLDFLLFLDTLHLQACVDTLGFLIFLDTLDLLIC